MHSRLVNKYLLFLMLLSSHLIAQPGYSSLSKAIDVGDSLMNSKKYIAAVSVYKQAVGYSAEEELARLYMKLGKGFFYITEYDSAYKYYQKASEAAYNQADFKTLGQAQNNLGVIHVYRYEYEAALNRYQKALEAYTALDNDSLIAITTYNIGNQYEKSSVYDKAIEYVIKSVSLFEKTKQADHLAKAYGALGSLFRYEKKYDKSIEYHKKSISISKSIGDYRSLAGSYNDIGNTYKHIENYDMALDFYQKSIDIKDQQGNNNKVVPLQNMGEIHLKLKQYDKAESVLQMALQLSLEYKRSKNQASILNLLGKLKDQTGAYDEAIDYLEKGKEIAEEKKMNSVLFDTYLYLKEYYERQGLLKQALKYYELHNKVKDEVYSAEKSRISEEMQVRYEVEKNQQEIALLSKDNLIKETQLEKEAFKNQALIVGLFLLVVLLAMLILAYRQSKKNAELQKAFLHDTQHRTKNFLQTLISLFSFQANQIDDPKARAAVKQGENRLNAMMMIHRSLSKVTENQAQHFNFSDYTEQLIMQLKTSYQKPDHDVKLVLRLGEIYLDTDKATPLALIVNELVSNAFKYGLIDSEEPVLEVIMKRVDSSLEISIKDNGKGLHDIEIDKLKSSGLKLVKLFTKQLKGEMEIKNTPGAEFNIVVQV